MTGIIRPIYISNSQELQNYEDLSTQNQEVYRDEKTQIIAKQNLSDPILSSTSSLSSSVEVFWLSPEWNDAVTNQSVSEASWDNASTELSNMISTEQEDSHSAESGDIQNYYIEEMIVKAFKGIEHTQNVDTVEEVLSRMGEKALEKGNLHFVEGIIKRMNYASSSDSLWKKWVEKYLIEDEEVKIEKVFKAIENMNYASTVDFALNLIGEKALRNNDISLAERALERMNNGDLLRKKIEEAKI